MTFFRHSALLWLYGALGVAAALFLPLLVSEAAFIATAAFGIAAFAVCALGHEAWVRHGQVRRRDDETAGLRAACDALQHEVTWLSREMVALRTAQDAARAEGPAAGPRAGVAGDGLAREGAGSGAGDNRVERVVAEVKILQSLIHRLYDERGPGPQDPAQDAAPSRLLRAEAPAVPRLVAEKPAPALARDEAPAVPDEVIDPERQRMGFAEALAASASNPSDTAAPDQSGGVAEGALAPPIPYELTEGEILEVARKALRDDRVDLVLQPIVTLPQRKRRFFEAFSRLRTEDGYAVLPEQYIKLAEREGLVTTIDNLLLFRCVQLVRKIQRRGDELDFFCNISRRSWEDDGFFNDFIDFLRSNLHLAENLIFEFTQLDFERWGAAAEPRMSQLAKLGCRFSLDQLRHLNFDPAVLVRQNIRFLKLAPEVFLEQVQAKPTVARELQRAGITVIIDKVEDEATLRELLDYEVGYAQGYLFSEPRLAKPAA